MQWAWQQRWFQFTLASSLLLKSSLPRLSVFIRLLGWPVHRTTETNIAPVRMHFFFSCWLLWHLGSSSFIRQGKLKTGTSKRESVIGAGVPAIVITHQSNWPSLKKSTNNIFWRGCGEKGTLLYCQWQCKLVQSLWRTVWRCLKKLKIELSQDPAIPFMGVYPEKNTLRKNTCTPMFTAALFSQDTEATYKSINRETGNGDVVHMCNAILLSH